VAGEAARVVPVLSRNDQGNQTTYSVFSHPTLKATHEFGMQTSLVDEAQVLNKAEGVPFLSLEQQP